MDRGMKLRAHIVQQLAYRGIKLLFRRGGSIFRL